MNGQWIGRFNGTAKGLLVLELDNVGECFEGWGYAWPDEEFPPVHCKIRTKGKSWEFEEEVPVFPVGYSWDEVEKACPEGKFSKKAKLKVVRDGDSLKIDWNTEINSVGNATVRREYPGRKADIEPISEVSTWDEFKNYISGLEHRHYIFRGQDTTKPLRTSFHRTGRADINRFITKDITTLHRHLSSRTRHVFNLEIAEQNGAFLNLVQHHGYPTPLLDWTFSPYVAAFFAYRNIRNSEASKAPQTERVRIFLFDADRWCKDYDQPPTMKGQPHFSVMEFISINNERLVPQQSISSVSNVDDIEGYLTSLQKGDEPYLRKIDLPINERPKVIQELSTMGITSGSMFPGLDGACAELRERFFEL